MYSYKLKKNVERLFFKLANKDPNQLETIYKKINKIISNPYHKYKFLKKPLQNFNSLHLNPFVLVFKINHKERIVDIYYYDHHDKIYKWRPTN